MSVNKVNQSTGELSPIAGGTLYADAPVGSIQAYGGATAPWGWLLCQGQAVSRATYAELFGVIGTSFGEGDGSSTFNVPDLRETAPVGSGTRGSGVTTHDTYTVGQFKDDQLQSHTHSITSNVSARTLDNRAPVSNTSGWTFFWGGDNTNDNTGRTGATTHGKQLGVNYIIKATTIALPSDFEAAVDDKIADNIIDSITDGNMKAATSNAVFDQLKNFCMTVQASGTLTIDGNGQQGISLTYTCPQGYTPILAIPHSAGSWAWVWSYCHLQDTSHVYAVIKSTNTFQETQTIYANVLCVRAYS